MVPIYVAWKCYPEKKGLMTSIVYGANGVGTMVASLTSTLIVNPYNAKPNIEI